MNKIINYFDTFITSLIRLRISKRYLHFSFLKIQFQKQISIKEQVVLFKRLAMMLRAQLPIVTCLEMIAEESKRSNAGTILTEVAKKVASGQTLGNALGHYHRVFSFFSLSIITIGEQSGTLPENLEYVAVELKKKQDLRKQILGALIYPLIIVVATLTITVFLIVYIFPKIVPIFLSVKTTLPWSTQFLISVSTFLTIYGWYVIGTFILLAILVTFFMTFPSVEYFITSLLLTLPIIGTLCRSYNLAQMSRTLGLLLQSDVPILSSLRITAESTQNIVYRQKLELIRSEIQLGKNLSNELLKTPHLFPSLVVNMVQAGERTGNMPTTLSYISELYEGDIRDLTKNLTTVIEPLLMLFMGLLVGFVAISIITPIYGITQNLHQ
jgi:type IV pilus assembly protein PilC